MKIYNRIEIDMVSGKVVDAESIDYEGDIALCCGGGPGGPGGGGAGIGFGGAGFGGAHGGQGFGGAPGSGVGGGSPGGPSATTGFDGNMEGAALVGAATVGAMVAASNMGVTPAGAPIHGPDPRAQKAEPQAQRAALKPALTLAAKTTPAPEKKIIAKQQADRPRAGRTIATSPLGVSTPPTIRRKTLLGQ